MKATPLDLRTALLVLLLLAPAATAKSPQGQGGIPFGDPEEVGYLEPFFPGTSYDPAILTPDAVLGGLHGSRLSHHAEILTCFETWAEQSPRLKVERYASTHEGRDLILGIFTSPANHERLDSILADLGRLHDPRGLDEARAEQIVSSSPASAWMGYSIHGDELSGCDAGLALGYHLVAAQDDEIERMLEELVIVIDPVLNPDGRERIVGMVEQSAGYTPNYDYASMHRGRWPYGRGNHYLFDMNRDWMAGSQPETRGRWRAALRFHPQLFVDAHEMGALDTFLFYPQAAPLNENYPQRSPHWQTVFAQGAAEAFDGYGWSYYTREWADGWAPFYSDAWGSLIGATGILYEQARTHGTPLRRASGEILTYRESVHHQAVASLSNLRTLVANREEMLRDYLANKRRLVAADTPGNDRWFVARTSHHPERVADLARRLRSQGVEVFAAGEAGSLAEAEGHLGQRLDALDVPAGSLVVPARQPLGSLVRAFLEFDPRMGEEFLAKEREDLERGAGTNIYDVSAWSLPHAFDLDAWWCAAGSIELTPWTWTIDSVGPAVEDAYAWIVAGDSDASVAFAARALEAGVALHLSDREFTTAGTSFPRGSLLVRRAENRGVAELGALLARLAARTGARLVATRSGRSPDEGPDLGGGHFRLLARPRVAVLGNAPIATDTYGHLWHHLDAVLGLPFTLLDAQALGSYDLRRYNVLVLPPAWGGLSNLIEPIQDSLEAWIENGGTLIACGNAAAALTEGSLGISAVVRRRDVLEDLGPYLLAAERERQARKIEIDPAEVWGDADPNDAAEEDETEEIREEEDAWMRRFSPEGASLRAFVDDRHWITVGNRDEMPVPVGGSSVFWTDGSAHTAIRLGPEENLRLGGLVWPEARERLAESSWLTTERRGNGQIILFAAVPAYRGYQLASARLFSNAVVYGPGLGADQPSDW